MFFYYVQHNCFRSQCNCQWNASVAAAAVFVLLFCFPNLFHFLFLDFFLFLFISFLVTLLLISWPVCVCVVTCSEWQQTHLQLFNVRQSLQLIRCQSIAGLSLRVCVCVFVFVFVFVYQVDCLICFLPRRQKEKSGNGESDRQTHKANWNTKHKSNDTTKRSIKNSCRTWQMLFSAIAGCICMHLNINQCKTPLFY